ncbi:LysR family transcriptional regulator [Sphingomonas sp. PP-CE-3G-477]|uniref:LysR family transcriptional regulator n=1 Tax=Sphingomonas sp. PP-CE-3G-477 TaxID=2135660 RepID=UPI000D3CA3CE|nr:LysR family transcriptional regulator [Sphingomonas sp. PP-CE-3G-477]PTQ66176.1 LysR family transcriptional regulator [Sphingomonas sp. PP-CE-3G-477]
MIPSERLKGIEAFVCTADAGSFTAAGVRLNLTNSAVSKSVARLEARLGSRLFERTTRRLTLTDVGAAFYETCVRVLGDLADAEAVLAAHRSEIVGRLKVNVPIAFGRMQAMPLLLAFAERHPNLRPSITFTDRKIDIVEEGVDVAIRIGASEPWPDNLGHRYLGSERVIVCAAPAYLDRRGTPASAAALGEFDCILYGRGDGSTINWRFAREGGQVEEHLVEARIVLGSAEAQVGAVKAGFGIAQLATWLIKDELDRGELVEILPELATVGLPLHLVWRRSRQLTPKVDALLKTLTEGLRIE